MKMSNLPTSFDSFEYKKKKINNLRVKGLLNRFAYRYRLAKSFTSINAAGIGRTLKGYDAILKLFLSYTAYEEIMAAALAAKNPNIKHIIDNSIINNSLAAKVRSNNKLKYYLQSYEHSDDLKYNLKLMFDGKYNDVSGVAYAIRNIFAHGDLTPTTLGLTTNADRKLITDIADYILLYCDQTFTNCIENLKLK